MAPPGSWAEGVLACICNSWAPRICGAQGGAKHFVAVLWAQGQQRRILERRFLLAKRHTTRLSPQCSRITQSPSHVTVEGAAECGVRRLTQ